MKLLTLFLFFTSFIFATYEISNCTIINSPGNFLLTKDINAILPHSSISVPFTSGTEANTCFFMNSSNVLFDCNNHQIIGDFESWNQIRNISIKNCHFINNSAIAFAATKDVVLENLVIGHGPQVIQFTNVTDILIHNIHISHCNGGLKIKNSKNITITSSDAENSYDPFVIDASDLTIENSEVVNSSEAGFYIVPTSGRLSNIVIKNTKSNFNKEGFRIMSADNVVFENNQAKNNSNEGVIFETSNNVQISNLDATGNSAGLRITGPSEDVKLSKINTSNNKYLGLSTFLIKKLEMESIFACSNKLNDTSIRESDYSKSNIICDKSNPETLCDVKCSSTKDGSNSKNDKNCIGALLLASILFLVFKRG